MAKKKKKRGRPPKKKSELMIYPIYIRFTQEERRRIDKAVNGTDLRLSDWVRQIILESAPL